jgi:hypothetical protein
MESWQGLSSMFRAGVRGLVTPCHKTNMLQNVIKSVGLEETFWNGAHPVSYSVGTRGSFPGDKATGA